MALSDPNNVTNSFAFSTWVQKMQDHLSVFERELTQRVAWEQTKKNKLRPVRQTIVRKNATANLGGFNLFEIRQDSPFVIGRSMFYLPVSESVLQKLTSTPFRYKEASSNESNIRFKRFEGFVDKERLFSYAATQSSSYLAKNRFVPFLKFPFLPYSRKYVYIVDEFDKLPGESSHIPPEIYLSNIDLAPLEAEDRQQIKAAADKNIIPVWNLREDEKMIGPHVRKADLSGATGYRWDIGESDFSSDCETHLTKVRYKRKEIVSVPDIARDYIFSRVNFDEVVYYEVYDMPEQLDHPVLHAWVSSMPMDNLDPSRLFWYRQFLQSIEITKSDISQLFKMIPDLDGYIELDGLNVRLATEHDIESLDGAHRKFQNPLWYVQEERLQGSEDVFRAEKTRVIELHIRRGPRISSTHEGSVNEMAPYLVEDLANYAAAICELSLPFGMICKAKMIDS